MKTKWYNKWWIWAIVVLVIGYFGVKKSVAYYNYTELIKVEKDRLFKEVNQLDSIIKIQEADIKKLKSQRLKINTSSETQKILLLEQQLQDLRKKNKASKDTLSPENLNIYLENLLK